MVFRIVRIEGIEGTAKPLIGLLTLLGLPRLVCPQPLFLPQSLPPSLPPSPPLSFSPVPGGGLKFSSCATLPSGEKLPPHSSIYPAAPLPQITHAHVTNSGINDMKFKIDGHFLAAPAGTYLFDLPCDFSMTLGDAIAFLPNCRLY